MLHGILRTHRCMSGLARHLSRQGFEVENLGYPSTRHTLQELAEIIRPRVEKFASSVQGTLHFVGYSMGGLLIRAYLEKYRPERLGRVVMIATPNKGSEVADFLQHTRIYRWLYGKAGQQLVTDQRNFLDQLGKVSYPLGVIAGNKPNDPISSRIIGLPNDGKVSVSSTMIEGMSDHILVPTSHTFIPSNRKVWDYTESFLKNGRFLPS